MEEKKSRKADLERLRPIMLGAAAVLSSVLFLALLEVRVNVEEEFPDEEILSMLQIESDLGAVEREDADVVAVKIEEKRTEQPQKIVKGEEPEEQEPEEPGADPIPADVTGETEPVPPAQKEKEPQETPPLRIVEDIPQFPGGMMAFIGWLTQNLRYPSTAQMQKLQGKVVAQFVVNEDGTVDNIEVIKPLRGDCDREALRVLGMMPRWTPGVKDGKPCRTVVCVPIVFKL